MKGKVYIAGAGPGSPDLITVRGLKILREADVIVYDYLVPELLLEESKRGALKIRADKLGARRGASDSGREQDRVSSFTVRKAKEGKKVLRLKNGDVSIFSRLSQELETLGKNGIEYEIVPGVTSASAASAYSGIPLTDREKSSTCVFVTGRENPKKKESGIDWQSAAKQGTIVVYMGIENIGEI
ncbi:MAG TPA: uroporphyrinogen-III C-methyltransferase, partial [bacterium]|nr:uroporphyrinogen-III C-methyltransferase [bacterium]